jgi:Flp pilus assembly pilin Flp
MTNPVTKFVADRSGATAIEYALICSLIVLAIIASLYAYQANVGAMYAKIQNAMAGSK